MSGAGPAHDAGHGESTSDTEVGLSFAEAMATSMARMMGAMHAAVPSGDPDRDFLAMMIPHHEGAVEMARLVLLHGTDPLTRQLAEEIMASQAVEIAAMRGRLAVLRSPGVEYPALGGTRGTALSR